MCAGQTIRVMLIDDHRVMLWGLERLIEGKNSGMEVVGTARSCEEALAQIGKMVPDVILLDLDLDGNSSLEILPALMANGVSRVLVLTASREQSMLDDAVRRGARGVAQKDAAPELVLKAIEKVHQGELWLESGLLARVFSSLMTPDTTNKRNPEHDGKATLSAKEREIIRTVATQDGASNKIIAQRLFISEHTLRNHLTSIYQKLGVRNRLELYVFAVKHQFEKCASEGSYVRH